MNSVYIPTSIRMRSIDRGTGEKTVLNANVVRAGTPSFVSSEDYVLSPGYTINLATLCCREEGLSYHRSMYLL